MRNVANICRGGSAAAVFTAGSIAETASFHPYGFGQPGNDLENTRTILYKFGLEVRSTCITVQLDKAV
jgi:hypothetical protein